MIAAPEPGIYPNVDFDEYLDWDAISNSRINLARRSLAHFRANASLESTPGIRIGSLSHCGKLEPLMLARRYAVMPRFEDDESNLTAKGEKPDSPRSTKYYREKAKEFETVNSDKQIVSQSEYDRMVAIVTSLNEHPRSCEYFGAPGPMEIAIVWDDPETRLRCKARLDKYTPGTRIVDLKTYTPEQGYLSPLDKFVRSIANYGYHRQMAHYQNGVSVLTQTRCEPALVVVENVAPYCVMAARMNEEWLEIGRREVAETLRAIRDAYDRNTWTGYESPDAWFVPNWYGANENVSLIIGGEMIEV